MPRVYFSHSLSKERRHIIGLLHEKAWFERQHFSVYLPKNTSVKLSGKTELREKMARVQARWKVIERDFFNTISTFSHTKIVSSYVCHVSRYGPEGRYGAPNIVFLRLRSRLDEKKSIECVGHELLHLILHQFCQAKRLGYREREGLVDSIILESGLAHLFPGYQRQSVGKITKRIVREVIEPVA